MCYHLLVQPVVPNSAKKFLKFFNFCCLMKCSINFIHLYSTSSWGVTVSYGSLFFLVQFTVVWSETKPPTFAKSFCKICSLSRSFSDHLTPAWSKILFCDILVRFQFYTIFLVFFFFFGVIDKSSQKSKIPANFESLKISQYSQCLLWKVIPFKMFGFFRFYES